MAEKKIKFTVGNVCGEDGIVANPPAVALKNNNPKIKFENALGAEATVYFYPLEKEGKTAILDFCDGVEIDGALKLEAGEKKDCRPNDPGNFSYTVQADPYPLLDPIIIIEDSMAADPSGWIPFLFFGIGGAAVGAFGAHMRMKAKMKQNPAG